MKRLSRIALTLGLALGTAASTAAAVNAQEFAPKRINMIIPFAVGGGADTYARIIAPHLQKQLPGEPTIVLQNVPGAGSIAGANQFQDRAKPDGLTLLTVSSSTIFNYALQDPLVKYDIKSYIPIISNALGTIIYIRSDLGVKGIEDIKELAKKDLVFGANSPTSSDARILLSFEMLGLKVRPVFGLNRGPIRLGFERGEFNINYDVAAAYLADSIQLVKAGKAVPLFTFGFADANGNIGRDPNFPEIPTFIEMYKAIHGKEPSGPAYEAWLTFFNIGIMNNKAILLPAGTPANIVKTYRDAMGRLLKSKEFLAVAAEELGNYPVLEGDASTRSLEAAATLSPEARAWVRNWLKEKYDVK
jgi:tripartite-type tricarboxylate transporter receptor subunit TctC